MVCEVPDIVTLRSRKDRQHRVRVAERGNDRIAVQDQQRKVFKYAEASLMQVLYASRNLKT